MIIKKLMTILIIKSKINFKNKNLQIMMIISKIVNIFLKQDKKK